MERVDQMLASTAVRLDQTLNLVQGAVAGPVRQGTAVVAAFRAAVAVFRGLGARHRAARDDEEALFVG
jgi:phosphohistidine phosphatase SixA